MKIIILAAAALVATTLSAAADHGDDGGHDDGGVRDSGEAVKLAATGTAEVKNLKGLSMSGSTSISAEEASPGTVDVDVLGARMPDASSTE